MGRPILVLAAVLVPLAAAVGTALWLALGEAGIEPADAGRPLAPPGERGDAAPSGPSVKRGGATAKVSGEVRRASDGKPGVGLRVALEGVGPKALGTSTDANGAFEFADVPHGGPYEVVVSAPDCAEAKAPGIELKRGEVRDVGTLWLAPAVPVAVEVRTFAGEPIVGADVEAFLVRPDSPGFGSPTPPTPMATMTTGADGLVRFSGLSVGTWTFVAQKSGFARRGSPEERLDPGEPERRIQLALEHGWRVEGRVLTRAGATIPGASVVALRRTLDAGAATAPLCTRARSDAEGRYALESLPGADVCVWAARPGGRLAIVAAVRPPGVPRLDLVLPDPSYVTGRVTDHADGAPLAGAVLTASFQILGGIELPCDATADESGAYRMALPMRGSLASLEAVREGYVRASDVALTRTSFEIPEGATIVRDLTLERGAALTGVVRGPDGPVAGANVTAYLRAFAQSVSTDREGRYRFDALARGPAIVGASRVGFEQKEFPENVQSALADGSAPKRYVVEIPDQGAAVLDVTLDAGTSAVHGIVRSALGATVEGARVGVTGDDSRQPTTTAKDGAFRVDRLVAGQYVDLWVRKDGFAPFVGSFEASTEESASSEITLRPARRVTGTVRAASGASLVDAYVQIGTSDARNPVNDEWTWLAEARRPVRANGSFEIDVTDGRESFSVRAKAAGLAPSVSAPLQFAADGEVAPVELVLGADHALAGVVRTSHGDPVAGAWVAIFPRTGPQDVSQESNGAWGPAVVAVADAAGRFNADDLAPGWWGVRAWGESTMRGLAVVEVPRETQVEVQVESALAIDGTVVIADGGPVADASIVATGRDGDERQTLSDVSGAFRIAGLGPGDYSIRVSPSETGRANFVSTTRGGVAAGTRGLRFELTPGLSIAGVVIDGDGRPVSGATPTLRDLDTGAEIAAPSTCTDTYGRFEVVGLRPGRVSLTVGVQQDDGQAAYVFDGIAVGARDLRIELPKTALVEGVLVDESGAPIGGAEVRAVPESTAQATGRDARIQQVVTNIDGSFSFRAAGTTSYRLQLTQFPTLGLIDAPPVRAGGPPPRLVAKAGASIAGVVVDKAGKPVAGVSVCASFDDCVRKSTSGADGAFEIRGLNPGASCDVYLQSDVVVQVPPQPAAAGRRDVRFVVERGLEASGRLVDRDGVGLANYRVLLGSAEGGRGQSVRTGEDGSFAIRGLPSGEWQAKAQPWWVYDAADAEPRPCGTVRAGDHDVTLRVDVAAPRPNGR